MGQGNAPDKPPGKPLVLARIGKTHGIKGWLRLISYTDPADTVLGYERFQSGKDGGGVSLEIDQHRFQGDSLFVHFKGYDDPDTARRLTGLDLTVDRERLPALTEGEYYWHQLEDLVVINQQGELFGRVKYLLDTGANNVLVVAPTAASIDDRERLIPYLQGTVITGVDLEAGKITVDWAADYLE